MRLHCHSTSRTVHRGLRSDRDWRKASAPTATLLRTMAASRGLIAVTGTGRAYGAALMARKLAHTAHRQTVPPTKEAASDASRAPIAAAPRNPHRLALAPSSLGLGLGSGTSLISQDHRRKDRFFINPAWINWLNATFRRQPRSPRRMSLPSSHAPSPTTSRTSLGTRRRRKARA